MGGGSLRHIFPPSPSHDLRAMAPREEETPKVSPGAGRGRRQGRKGESPWSSGPEGPWSPGKAGRRGGARWGLLGSGASG